MILKKKFDWRRQKNVIRLLIMISSFKCKTMISYCLKRKKKKEKNINPRVSQTSNEKIMSLSKWVIYSSKKLRFIKKQQAHGLSSLGLKTPLSKIPLLSNNLFSMEFHWIIQMQFNWCYSIILFCWMKFH